MPMVESLFRAARACLGEEIHLLHDLHNRLTTIESARLGKSLEACNLLFLEDASVQAILSSGQPTGRRDPLELVVLRCRTLIQRIRGKHERETEGSGLWNRFCRPGPC